MTYSEIDDAIRAGKALDELEITAFMKAAYAVIKELEGRSGFDEWWYFVDDDRKCETFDDIQNSIARHL